MIEPIAPLDAPNGAPVAPAVAPPTAPGRSFGDWVVAETQALNRQLVAAETGVRELAAGSAVELHDVMIRLEQARLALQLASQVRARVVEAYQDVMRMQV